MKLTDFIAALNRVKERHGGEIIVYVNGEYGENSPEVASSEHLSVGTAETTLGGDLPEGLGAETIIMQIGGY